jgi:putative ABC transport system permease protein
MNTNLLRITWKQFSERKLRSALTIIGIVIGIAALISLILLSAALKNGITDQFESIGTDVILVAPKAALGGGGPPSGIGVFTDQDVRVIESIPQIREVNPFLGQNFEIEYGREKTRLQVNGIEADETYEDFISVEIEFGRFLQVGDEKSLNIGSRIARDTFDKDIFVGNSLRVNGEKYTVIGIFKEEGEIQSDTLIYAPISAVRDTIGEKDAITAIAVQVSPGADLVVMDQRISDALEKDRGEKDFETTTPIEIANEIGGLLGVVDLIVISIALVSLFVASLGITNSLFTSVTQRTNEIGTMKAVGAKNSQILSLFLFESAILGLLGGVVGVIVGLILAFGIAVPLNSFGFFQFSITLDYMLMGQAILFSMILGILSGILPAIKATRMKPVEALRHE